jgi:hypothetical protein
MNTHVTQEKNESHKSIRLKKGRNFMAVSGLFFFIFYVMYQSDISGNSQQSIQIIGFLLGTIALCMYVFFFLGFTSLIVGFLTRE